MADAVSPAEELAQAPAPLFSAPERLDYVDGLRAIAALLVILDHSQMMIYSRTPGYAPASGIGHLTRWFLYGHYGVSMFIVVSGFCLMLPVVRSDGTLRGGFRSFLKRRARRLLPPYYLSIAACLIIGGLWNLHGGTPWDGMESWDPSHVTMRVLLLHLVMVQQCFPDVWPLINSVYWSLGVEWWIYFLFPLLLFGWRKIGPLATIAIASALGIAVYVPIHQTYDRVCPHFVGLFAIGMLAATIAFDDRWEKVRKLRWNTIAAFALAILPAAASRIPFPALDEAVSDFAISAVLLTVLVAGAQPGWVRTLLSMRGLVSVGVFSYSVYLMHLPWMQIIYVYLLRPRLQTLGQDGAMLALIVAGIPLMLAWSYVFFLVCEAPFLNRRK